MPSCFSRVPLWSGSMGSQPATLLCPWDSPGKSTGVSCHFLLQGIFPTQGLNPHLLTSLAVASGFFTTSAIYYSYENCLTPRDTPEDWIRAILTLSTIRSQLTSFIQISSLPNKYIGAPELKSHSQQWREISEGSHWWLVTLGQSVFININRG